MATATAVTDQAFSDLDDILQPLLEGQEGLSDEGPMVGFAPQVPYVPEAKINILNLEDMYDKIQKKTTATGSEQRIANGKVHMVVNTSAQLRKIGVFVRRVAEAARKTNDTVGPMELPVQYKNHEVYKTEFCVDLDSVYKTQDGSQVYWLDRVEVEERNIWELIILVEFIDGTNCTFQSKPFRLRTRPRPPKKADTAHGQTPSTSSGNPSPAGSDQTSSEAGEPTNKRKRSSPSGCSSGAPPDTPYSSHFSESPFSVNGGFHGDGGESAHSTRTTEALLTDYLEAQRACIKELQVNKMICTPNADIAYHVQLKGPYYRAKDLVEGDVVGFFEQKGTGQTEIALLTHDNAREARMAGVISRSAYLQGNVPTSNIDLTDTVCVIGIVKVKVAGPVQNGERVYASLDQPGLAVPETQIPLRRMENKTPILLGQSLESADPHKMIDVTLVKCFVSIVMGIQSQQLSNAILQLQNRVHVSISDTVTKEKKKFVRGLIWKAIIILIILALLTYLMYELFAPGSMLRYYICKKGSIRPQRDVWFTFTTKDYQTPRVHGIEFKWEKLRDKLGLQFDKINNLTGMHYYLNLDRCAYGGVIMVSSYLDHRRQVRGAEIFAVNSTCGGAYFEMGGGTGHWQPYTSGRDFDCEPPYDKHKTHSTHTTLPRLRERPWS